MLCLEIVWSKDLNSTLFYLSLFFIASFSSCIWSLQRQGLFKIYFCIVGNWLSRSLLIRNKLDEIYFNFEDSVFILNRFFTIGQKRILSSTWACARNLPPAGDLPRGGGIRMSATQNFKCFVEDKAEDIWKPRPRHL